MNEVGFTLAHISPDKWLGKWVIYKGQRRRAELGNDEVFQVIEKRDDNVSIAFDAGIYGKQWCSPHAVQIAEDPVVEAPKPLTLEQAESILDPHSQTAETIDNEIARLTARIEQLKIAKQVIATL